MIDYYIMRLYNNVEIKIDNEEFKNLFELNEIGDYVYK